MKWIPTTDRWPGLEKPYVTKIDGEYKILTGTEIFRRQHKFPKQIIEWLNESEESQKGYKDIASNEDWKERIIDWYVNWDDHPKLQYPDINQIIERFESNVVAPLLLQVKELKEENKELLEMVNSYETVQCGGSLEILVKKFLESQQQLSPEMANVLNKTYSRLFSKTPTKL